MLRQYQYEPQQLLHINWFLTITLITVLTLNRDWARLTMHNRQQWPLWLQCTAYLQKNLSEGLFESKVILFTAQPRPHTNQSHRRISKPSLSWERPSEASRIVPVPLHYQAVMYPRAPRQTRPDFFVRKSASRALKITKISYKLYSLSNTHFGTLN